MWLSSYDLLTELGFSSLMWTIFLSLIIFIQMFHFSQRLRTTNWVIIIHIIFIQSKILLFMASPSFFSHESLIKKKSLPKDSKIRRKRGKLKKCSIFCYHFKEPYKCGTDFIFISRPAFEQSKKGEKSFQSLIIIQQKR